MSPLREVESGATEFRMSSGSRGKRMTNNVRFDDEDLNDRLNNNEIGRDYKVKPSLESF